MGRVAGRAGRLVAVLAATSAACASVIGPPEDTPPEAPSARILRFLPPAERDEIFPPPQAFTSRSWLDRVVCPVGDQPGWRRTGRRGMVETYEIDCPGQAKVQVTLDSGAEPPVPPAPLRLLATAGAAKYREAVEAIEKKDPALALEALEAAHEADPAEVVYRREKVYALYALGRTPEAILEADDLLDSSPDPIAWKYRALAARDLGLGEEVLESIDGIIQACPKKHPLYAEAVCAKGMFLAAENQSDADAFMAEGCRLEHKPCCEALETRRVVRERAQRALQAARALPVTLPDQSRPPTVAATAQKAPDEPADAPKKAEKAADRAP